MKKIGLIGGGLLVVILVVTIVLAGKMGKTSPAFARGQVLLDQRLVSQAQNAQALFITVFDQDQPMPPYGALRKSLDQPIDTEVYDFVLTYDRIQRMRADLPWPETFRVKARLDMDGIAGPDQPGDLTGELNSLSRGAEDLRLIIDRAVD